MPINDPVLAEAAAKFQALAAAAVPMQLVLNPETNEARAVPDPASPATAEITQKLNHALRLYSGNWRVALGLGEECPNGWKFCPEDGACIPEGQSCGGVLEFAEALAYLEVAAGQYFDLAITKSQRNTTRQLFLDALAAFEASISSKASE
jgi:hypothetical protein